MRELPILFNGDMVRAILDGRKTQTRRPIKPQPPEGTSRIICGEDGDQALCLSEYEGGEFSQHIDPWRKCPYAVGDHLYVRETWADPCNAGIIAYRADQATAYENIKWRPSIHMPKWAARLWLEVTEVRVEPVRGIDGMDALSEGITLPAETEETFQLCPNEWPLYEDELIAPFRELWDATYAKRGLGWDANPWVWVYEFRRIEL